MSDSEDVKGDPETRKRRFEEEAMAHAEVESTNPIMHSPLDIPPTIVPAEYETETPLLKKERIELAVPEETLYFKVLIPNTIIGNIIGKAGACVNGMMMTTRAKIKVSQNHEFFPETDDRIVVISGPSDNIQYAIYEIITKFCEIYDKDPHSQLSHTAPTVDPLGNRKYTLKATIPIAASGSILGRGGATIREIADRTGTKVQLVETADPYQTRERIVLVSASSAHSGALALQTVFSHLQVCDKSVGTYINTTSNYGPAGNRQVNNPVSRAPAYPPPSMGYNQQQSYYPPSGYPPQAYSGGRAAAPTGMPGMPSHGQQYGYPSGNGQLGGPQLPGYTIQIGVPDVLIGAVLGRGGSVVKDIMAQSGTRIHVAQKGEHMPGTTNRCITVSGTQPQVELAQALIMHQLNLGASTAGYRGR